MPGRRGSSIDLGDPRPTASVLHASQVASWATYPAVRLGMSLPNYTSFTAHPT
jgi:hypothetical protein